MPPRLFEQGPKLRVAILPKLDNPRIVLHRLAPPTQPVEQPSAHEMRWRCPRKILDSNLLKAAEPAERVLGTAGIAKHLRKKKPFFVPAAPLVRRVRCLQQLDSISRAARQSPRRVASSAAPA